VEPRKPGCEGRIGHLITSVQSGGLPLLANLLTAY